MVQAAKAPDWWGDDLNGVQINPNPSDDAPVTVADLAALTQPVTPSVAGQGMAMGKAPDPQTYAKLGELAGQLLVDPRDPTGDFQASGMMYNLGQLLAFHRGGPLDAQVQYGGSTPYANYAFGVYNAARGADLGDMLDLANTYGKLFSRYKDRDKLDKTYTSIPAENVQNITRGYNDYKNGTLQHRP